MLSSLESSSFFTRKTIIVSVVLIAVVVIAGTGTYKLGSKDGYSDGYIKAQTDIQNLQDEAANRAASEAAKSANPFRAVNPLKEVESNPFEKVKKVLNPFEN